MRSHFIKPDTYNHYWRKKYRCEDMLPTDLLAVDITIVRDPGDFFAAVMFTKQTGGMTNQFQFKAI